MRKAELDYLIKELNDTKKLLSDALEKVGWLEASIIERGPLSAPLSHVLVPS